MEEHVISIEAHSANVLNFNVTGALIETISSAKKAWKWASSIKSRNIAKDQFCLHWIENKTGVKLWYWGSDRGTEKIVRFISV